VGKSNSILLHAYISAYGCGVPWRAYIDESGQRSASEASSDHFILSAVVLAPGSLPLSTKLLAEIRTATGRQPGQRLHWKNFKPPHKTMASAMVGAARFLRIVSVIVCKRCFSPASTLPHEDLAYMYTFRLMLERLSWLGRRQEAMVGYTLSHVVHFKKETLSTYEKVLRNKGGKTEIDWQWLDPSGGKIDGPRTLEQLQLPDLVASGTAEAFEPNKNAAVMTSYLENYRPRLFRHGNGAITTYGLKMHPWNGQSKEEHAWLTAW
jgi:hypothetical protein